MTFALVRLADERDRQKLLIMAQAASDETGEPICISAVNDQINKYFVNANPTIFVVEAAQRQIVGCLAGRICQFDHKPGLYTTQRFLYVEPAFRRTRAAASLVRELIAWSRIVGASEIHGGNSNGFRTRAIAGLLGRQGFKQVGYTMKLDLRG